MPQAVRPPAETPVLPYYLELHLKLNTGVNRHITKMILPILNVDISWLVQIVVFLGYLGMLYALVLELLNDKPFRPVKGKAQPSPRRQTAQRPSRQKDAKQRKEMQERESRLI
ncbi:uncharacterized protein LOC116618412 [Nematostella vectensis]|uniref:uncharacterized protein LOC116618412 n=1 Tax=Nematostella vectensis TaxID=45351 RepID=UPI002077266E|nr:uncharacterized protein LOC116618412 [Nematostella vectensis]